MVGRGGFFLSEEGAIWSRIACTGSGLGPVELLTPVQLMFLALASMEDAQIKGGGGLVERSEISSTDDAMSVQDYFRLKREHEILAQQIREKQAPLRELLESRVRQMVLEEMKYR